MDFLDRCADADPETAALLMALYNEGVLNGSGIHWYDPDWYDGMGE